MLIEALRRNVADGHARSFRIAGDDFVSLTLEDLQSASSACASSVLELPLALRAEVLEQHRAHAREAHGMLRRFNTHITGRVHGYLELARLTGFELPWPIIAALGVTQIIDSSLVFHAIAFVAECLSRAGAPSLAEQTAEIDDMTRRTNRGVFADCVPMLLFAMRCGRLRRRGRDDLADALLGGPLPLTMDEGSAETVRALDRAFRIDDGHERFCALAKLSFEQFDREQTVFAHHIGAAFVPRGVPRWLRDRVQVRTTGAPVIEETPRGLELVYRQRTLPSGFDWTDHHARVDVMARLFCDPVTQSEDHFRASVAYLSKRYEPERPLVLPSFGAGGMPLPEPND